jgi:hypothetical protein
VGLFVCLFVNIRVGSWRLVLTRKALCHLSHIPSPFRFSSFSDRGSHFCPGLALNHDPPDLSLPSS